MRRARHEWALPGVYIRRRGRGSERAESEPGVDPSTLAVCEALIVGIGGTVAELTAATGLAPSTAAASLRFLQKAHLVESEAARGRNSRRTVADEESCSTPTPRLPGGCGTPESIRVGVLWRNPARG